MSEGQINGQPGRQLGADVVGLSSIRCAMTFSGGAGDPGLPCHCLSFFSSFSKQLHDLSLHGPPFNAWFDETRVGHHACKQVFSCRWHPAG
jgi:hypothetical protein